jgi:hypothetical protein
MNLKLVCKSFIRELAASNSNSNSCSITNILQFITLLPILALSRAVPTSKHGRPSFPTDNNYTITAAGTQGNQGAHVITPIAIARAASIARSLNTRNGAGSAVSGAGLDWYNSDFNTGNSGYSDPQYYYCFNGAASNFPAFSSWMNFYDMFDLNQNDQLTYEESGQIQGDIYNAIVSVSQDSMVDARFILAIIMQEVRLTLSLGLFPISALSTI